MKQTLRLSAILAIGVALAINLILVIKISQNKSPIITSSHAVSRISLEDIADQLDGLEILFEWNNGLVRVVGDNETPSWEMAYFYVIIPEFITIYDNDIFGKTATGIVYIKEESVKAASPARALPQLDVEEVRDSVFSKFPLLKTGIIYDLLDSHSNIVTVLPRGLHGSRSTLSYWVVILLYVSMAIQVAGIVVILFSSKTHSKF